jgi:hypothetical protein
MNTIYNVPGENDGIESEQCMNESAGPQMEKKFINEVINLVVEALEVGYRDRRLVEPLLRKALADPMDTNYKKYTGIKSKTLF